MKYLYFLFFTILVLSCKTDQNPSIQETGISKSEFKITKEGDQLLITATDGSSPVVTQNAQENHRPYLHPIKAPGTDVSLTQYSPGHHKHQTGLYWGFTRVNGTGADEETLKSGFTTKINLLKSKIRLGETSFITQVKVIGRK